ncbi:hypothetical protein GCM10027259_45950 [Micromonospora palomenae]
MVNGTTRSIRWSMTASVSGVVTVGILSPTVPGAGARVEPAARTQKGRSGSSCPAGSKTTVTSAHGEVTGVGAGCLNHRYERVTSASVPDRTGKAHRGVRKVSSDVYFRRCNQG